MLVEEGHFIVVGTVMPMSSQMICKVKAFDFSWSVNCSVTMIKRSAPLEIQAANMESEISHMNSLLKWAE